MFANGFMMGIFTTIVVLSAHSDALGKERWLKLMSDSWMDTTVWQWVVTGVVGWLIYLWPEIKSRL